MSETKYPQNETSMEYASSSDPNDPELKLKCFQIISRVVPEFQGIEYSTFSLTPTMGQSNLVLLASGNNTEKEQVKCMIKFYGGANEKSLDRREEIAIMKLTSPVLGGVRILHEMENGRIESFLEGVVLTPILLRKPEIIESLGRQVARLHSLQTRNSSEFLVVKMKNWLQSAAEGLSPEQAKILDSFRNDWKSWLENEIDKFAQSQMNSPMVLCHNDLHYGNLIYNEKKGALTLIDFEYASMNYRGFDLANIFTEFMADYSAEEILDPSKFPSEEEQQLFLRAYTQESSKMNLSNVAPADNLSLEAVAELQAEAGRFVPIALLFWGIWQMMMAAQGDIDGKYLAAGIVRLNLYCEFRKKF